MTQRMRPTWLTLAAIVIAAVCGMHCITHGFKAVTSEKARQLVLAQSPRRLPSIALVDSHGGPADLREIVSERPFTVVALVYTQCTSLCLLTGSSEAFLQTKLRGAGLEKRVRLVTISFDPARDTPDALARYARRVKADADLWTIATVADPSDLEQLLDAFGVVVIPDGAGDYEHNGALFLVDRRGRLFDALDPDAADLAFERLTALVHTP